MDNVYLNRIVTAVPDYDIHGKFIDYAPSLLKDERRVHWAFLLRDELVNLNKAVNGSNWVHFWVSACLWISKKEEKHVNLSFYANIGRFPSLLDFTKKLY